MDASSSSGVFPESTRESRKRLRKIQFKQRQQQQRELEAMGELEEGPQRMKHPKNLKGREIGMFYARLSKKDKRKEKQQHKKALKPIGSVFLSKMKREQISTLLNSHIPLSIQMDTKNYEHVANSRFKTNFMKVLQGNIQDRLEAVQNYNPNESLDIKLKEEFISKQQNQKYIQMQKQREKLPAYKMRHEILEMVSNNQIVIISGETGCGKTTQVAQFILDSYLDEGKGSMCKIVCSQPRRISAISVAERVADERAERLGESSGYQIRLERKMPRSRGSIVFCTTGVILKQMEGDVCLKEISHLILDEIHERDVQSDFLITLLKQITQKRSNLKVILMSATLNAAAFATYFGVTSTIEIPGFTYEVEEYFLEDVLTRTRFQFEPEKGGGSGKGKKSKQHMQFIMPHIKLLQAQNKYSKDVCKQLINSNSEEVNLDLILALIIDICQKERDQGAILVFLTGYYEISNLNTLMEKSGKFPGYKYLVIPLHSQMATTEQRHIFRPPPNGVRKIILSTNIAETSITIDDVVFVIDCGKIKMKNFKVETNQETLLPEWVSMANANQRRGRAGRVKPGVCFHLYSRARKATLEPYQKPEILRKRLEEVVLLVKLLQLGKAEDFLTSLMDVPDSRAMEVAIDLLKRLNALDDDENLTPLGFHLARLPMSPQMGKMILLGSIFSCLDPILSVATSLDFKDAFQMPLGCERQVDEKKMYLANGVKSDHLIYYEALKKFETVYDPKRFCWEYYLSFHTMKLLQNMKRQFMDYLYDLNFVPNRDPKCFECNQNSSNLSLVKAIICAGLYPNVVVNRSKVRQKHIKNKFFTLDSKLVSLHPKSVLRRIEQFESPLLVYYVKVKSTADFIHDATMVHPLPILFFGDNFEQRQEDGVHMVCVNGKLAIKCARETGRIIMELRDRLNWFLEHKASHPGFVDWGSENQDPELSTLRAIMELITIEDEGCEYEYVRAYDEAEDEDDE